MCERDGLIASFQRQYEQPATRDSFSVITFNTFTGPPAGFIDLARFRRQLVLLRQNSADVICLQEVFSESVTQLLQEEFSADYVIMYGKQPRMHMLLRCIARLLLWLAVAWVVMTCCRLMTSFSSWLFIPSVSAMGLCLLVVYKLQRSVGWAFAFGQIQAGLVIMCRRQSVQVRLFHAHLFDEQSGDFLNKIRARGFAYAQLLIHGKPVTIMTTHVNAFPSVSLANAMPIASPQRQQQLRQAFSVARDCGSKEGFVGTGDLNTNLADREIPAEELDLINAWEKSRTDVCITMPLTPLIKQVFPETTHGLCMDYQFCRALSVVNAQLIDACGLSDHLPLLVTYRLA